MKFVLLFSVLAMVFAAPTTKPPFTIITGFVNPPSGQLEVLRVDAPMYSDAKKTKTIGTFFLSCSKISKPGFAIFNPCELYFYFHPVGAIQKTTDIITASGVSVIANLTDLLQEPVLQQFIVTGGTGKYLGASGYMGDNYGANPGLNTFEVHLI
jgi:hypothetical protein